MTEVKKRTRTVENMKDDLGKEFESEFEMKGMLGRGAFGAVLECVDRSSGERVAVKVLSKAHGEEARLLSTLSHPNIFNFLRIVETSHHIFLVTELLEGGSLESLLTRRRLAGQGLTEDEAATILHKVLLALDYLHSSDIVHRDLKPQNILFASSEDLSSVRLIDFGLSVRSSGIHATEAGTPLYMPPEAFRTGVGAGKPGDIFAAGVLLFNLLTLGEHPLSNPGENRAEYIPRLKAMDTAPDLKERVSPTAAELLRRMLAPDPIERFTASQLLQHPFITRSGTEIPLTLAESIRSFALKQNVASLFKAVLFLKHIQASSSPPKPMIKIKLKTSQLSQTLKPMVSDDESVMSRHSNDTATTIRSFASNGHPTTNRVRTRVSVGPNTKFTPLDLHSFPPKPYFFNPITKDAMIRSPSMYSPTLTGRQSDGDKWLFDIVKRSDMDLLKSPLGSPNPLRSTPQNSPTLKKGPIKPGDTKHTSFFGSTKSDTQRTIRVRSIKLPPIQKQ
eukprot:TRINITY_DN6779_c0_g1_i5.p1 TRINITY_DN6779_c0_g1~~TRINITY_DN6779_c0_g1_i5.p1  ORF type:complete len:505 (-),score=75.08 TRINITY_DN6779_c0_g1_i5:49-1563(-)